MIFKVQVRIQILQSYATLKISSLDPCLSDFSSKAFNYQLPSNSENFKVQFHSSVIFFFKFHLVFLYFLSNLNSYGPNPFRTMTFNIYHYKAQGKTAEVSIDMPKDVCIHTLYRKYLTGLYYFLINKKQNKSKKPNQVRSIVWIIPKAQLNNCV